MTHLLTKTFDTYWFTPTDSQIRATRLPFGTFMCNLPSGQRIPTPQNALTEWHWSRQAFQPRLHEILKLVHERMEQFVNDPEFYRPDELGEEEDPMAFPETARLTGAYYLASERYTRQERQGRNYYQLALTFHFLYPSPITQTDDDYFSLEAWVKMWCDTQDIELMQGLTYAAI